MKFSMIVLIVLLALVAAFGLQNPGEYTVRFLHLSWVTSMLGVIVASFAAGVLGGWLAVLPGSFRRRAIAATAAKRIRELEAEVGDLKKTVGKLTPPPGGTTQ